MERVNHLENLDLDLELDSAYGAIPEDAQLEAIVASQKIILSGETTDGVLEDAHYIYVNPEYKGALSPGQWQLYELLLTMQQSAVYTLTTLARLAESMGLEWSLAAGKRLENLHSLGAIAGLKL
jgi:hypothetical protein